jgi:hypothetical protein
MIVKTSICFIPSPGFVDNRSGGVCHAGALGYRHFRSRSLQSFARSSPPFFSDLGLRIYIPSLVTAIEITSMVHGVIARASHRAQEPQCNGVIDLSRILNLEFCILNSCPHPKLPISEAGECGRPA